MMNDDERIVDELRAAAGTHDPVPAGVRAAAAATFTWRTIDAELAELTYDSAEASELAGVRGASDVRLVTFEGAGVAVDLEVTVEPDGRRLEGQLIPPLAGAIEVQHGAGTLTAAVDDVGRFSFSGIEAGPLRLRVTSAIGDRVPVTTSWIAV